VGYDGLRRSGTVETTTTTDSQHRLMKEADEVAELGVVVVTVAATEDDRTMT